MQETVIEETSVPRTAAHRRRVAAIMTAAALTGGPAVAVPAAGTAPVPDAAASSPRTPGPPASPWSAGAWVSGNGNTVADVANVIGAKSGSAAKLTGSGVGVALIDTGVVPVPGLPAASFVNGPDLSFESQSKDLRYLDTYGHGTHLAGIINGIAPGAKITSVKVGASSGAVDVSQVIAALDWVVQHRNDDAANPIRVVCLAYGTDAASDVDTDPLLLAVENANNANVHVVVAGGNAGTSLGRVNSPALDQYVLTVGSVATQGTVSQKDDTLSSFTSVNNSDSKLDVVAPGERIVSLRNPGSYIDTTYPGARIGDTQFRGSGSSQAAAVAAAAVALLLQKDATVPPHEMRQWLRGSSTKVAGSNGSKSNGEINVATALNTKIPRYDPVPGGSNGTGSLESARGSTHVVDNDVALRGNASIFGTFNSSTWAAASKKGTAWKGGLWMGNRMAGDGWTGTSWASKTWASATWTGTDWNRQSWADSSWNGRYWSGRYWSTGNWSGRYWSSSTWKVSGWQ